MERDHREFLKPASYMTSKSKNLYKLVKIESWLSAESYNVFQPVISSRENKFPNLYKLVKTEVGGLRKMLINGYKTVFDPIQQSEKKTMKQINEYYLKKKFPYIKTLDEIISMEFQV